jgi:hypothetical protein
MQAMAGGTLEVQAANDDVLAIWTFATPAATDSGAVLTWSFSSTSATGETAAGAGVTATKARLKNSGGTVLLQDATVGLTSSGSEVELDNTNIADGQTINLTGTRTFTLS